MRFHTNFQMNVRDALAARHEPEAQYFLASIYWNALVTTFVGIVIVSLGFGAWEFFWTPMSTETVVNARPQAVFTRVQLQQTLEGFDARAERFDERMLVPISGKDPS